MKRVLKVLALSIWMTAPALAQIEPADFNAAMQTYLASEEGRAAITIAMQQHVQAQQARAQKDAVERRKSEIESQFANPVNIDIGSSPVIGPANAKVTVFEFSNFECGHCSRGAATMAELLKAYPNDVKIVFKHLPLGLSSNSDSAARASLAAGKQGKFWEFHDALFKNQRGLNREIYAATAKNLGLNLDKFETDMDSEVVKNQIANDVAAANKLEVTGTPSFSVNGVMVRGAFPLEYFKQLTDRWLEKLN